VARFDVAFPAAVAIVQHLPDRFAATFASFLRQSAALPVEIVTTRVEPRGGVIFIAGDDRHLVAASDGLLETSDAPPVGGHRPSATVLFQSLARVFGADAAGVVLSGIGDDGASGLLEMRARGALTIAESQATAAVFGMPRAAVDANAVVEVLPLDAIADRLIGAVAGDRA
jgi:two-component system chemotaxis response regulator CheB